MENRSSIVLGKAEAIHEQMASILRLAEKFGDSGSDELKAALNRYQRELHNLYAEELPIARLKDNSDLLVRAVGVSADHDAPMLKAVAFVADKVRTNLGQLSKSVSPMLKKIPTGNLPWVFNGFAHGSIMMGFSLQKPTEEIEKALGDELYEALSTTAQDIAFVPQFIDDVDVNTAIAEVITDPAIRDAVLIAAHNLSPTANIGLHTIEVGSRTGGYGELTMKSRQVLSGVIKKPKLLHKKHGSFTGVLEAADLGAGRLVMRNIIDATDVSAIRCLVPSSLRETIKKGFGELVTITGEYETDSTGKPRLFTVDTIEPSKHPQQSI